MSAAAEHKPSALLRLLRSLARRAPSGSHRARHWALLRELAGAAAPQDALR